MLSRENEKVIGIYCLDPRHFETTQYGFKKTEKFRTQFTFRNFSRITTKFSREEYLVISLLRLSRTIDSRSSGKISN